MIDHATAEHEAAHLVVGLALGLKLKRATASSTSYPNRKNWVALGLTWFDGGPRRRLACGIMCCAGVAWERRPGGSGAEEDERLARQFLTSAHDVQTGVRVAHELLNARRKTHARIASELCERDLTARDIEALVLDP